MKKILTLLIVALMGVGATALAESKQTLTINGETVSKVVARITFDGDNVVLTFSDATTQTADMGSVVLTFSVDASTAIYSMKSIVEDNLDIDGLEPDTQVVIYNAEGKKMLAARADHARAILQTHSLPGGVYMLKAGNQVIKFVKR